MDEWVGVQMNRRMDGWKGWVVECVNERTDRRRDEWTDEQMDISNSMFQIQFVLFNNIKFQLQPFIYYQFNLFLQFDVPPADANYINGTYTYFLLLQGEADNNH